jgi:hypothetical protein
MAEAEPPRKPAPVMSLLTHAQDFHIIDRLFVLRETKPCLLLPSI